MRHESRLRKDHKNVRPLKSVCWRLILRIRMAKPPLAFALSTISTFREFFRKFKTICKISWNCKFFPTFLLAFEISLCVQERRIWFNKTQFSCTDSTEIQRYVRIQECSLHFSSKVYRERKSYQRKVVVAKHPHHILSYTGALVREKFGF